MFLFFFFFQAEDGIRDYKVTGVQTCALPICPTSSAPRQTQPPSVVGSRPSQRPVLPHVGQLRDVNFTPAAGAARSAAAMTVLTTPAGSSSISASNSGGQAEQTRRP